MKIVVVDNSRVVLKVLSTMLEARGYIVELFRDGLEALEYLKQDPDVDVLITSLQNQSLSGFELCWETRLLPRPNCPIYIITMSSNYDAETLSEALDSGADEFIRKPPCPDEVYARLRVAERLKTMQERMFRLATRDSLTNLLNRRVFFEQADFLIEEAQNGQPLSAIIFDIDFFKKVNDTYGHAVGDDTLREVSSCASKMFDVVGRIGGEEFAVLLPNHDWKAALLKAEMLRKNISRLEILSAGNTVHVTCSLGVSYLMPGDDINDMLRRADIALYQAKQSGRNKVVLQAEQQSELELAS